MLQLNKQNIKDIKHIRKDSELYSKNRSLGANVAKNKNIATGRYGEMVALHYLKTKGYCILGRNIRLKIGEIDILAFKNNTFCIVEVKTTNNSFRDMSRQEDLFVFDSVCNPIRPEDALSVLKIKKLRLLAMELPLYIKDLTNRTNFLKRLNTAHNYIICPKCKVALRALFVDLDIQIDAVVIRLYSKLNSNFGLEGSSVPIHVNENHDLRKVKSNYDLSHFGKGQKCEIRKIMLRHLPFL